MTHEYKHDFEYKYKINKFIKKKMSTITKERKQFELKFQQLYNLFHVKNCGFKEKEAIFYNENKITIFKGNEIIVILR